ncbi:MAG: hypothetical protein M5U09_13925 [Gammaproteobacteria bacterium]|nr:hypothetical protein [Gammaproteobacteria bacterium]
MERAATRSREPRRRPGVCTLAQLAPDDAATCAGVTHRRFARAVFRFLSRRALDEGAAFRVVSCGADGTVDIEIEGEGRRIRVPPVIARAVVVDTDAQPAAPRDTT